MAPACAVATSDPPASFNDGRIVVPFLISKYADGTSAPIPIDPSSWIPNTCASDPFRMSTSLPVVPFDLIFTFAVCPDEVPPIFTFADPFDANFESPATVTVLKFVALLMTVPNTTRFPSMNMFDRASSPCDRSGNSPMTTFPDTAIPTPSRFGIALIPTPWIPGFTVNTPSPTVNPLLIVTTPFEKRVPSTIT